MSLFSKERLVKIVGSAKKHWWFFVPVLILLMLGYCLFSIIDAIQILFLHIRNLFLTIALLIRNCMRGLASFFSKIGNGIGGTFKRGGAKISGNWHRYCENAVTARNQLLNSAVDYCTGKAQARQDKKQRLNQIAKELRSGTKPEIIAAEPKTI